MSDRPPRLNVLRPDESVSLPEIPMARAWLQHMDLTRELLDGSTER
jgi:hypothetical protein